MHLGTQFRRLALSGLIRPVLFLYTLTLFLSAALLFLVQPMFARMVLPRLGGTPAVWNTCTVFFQAALLAGYAYAHFAAARPPARTRLAAHLGLLLLPLVALPIGIAAAWAPPRAANPVGSLLLLLLVSVGLPFFAVSTSGPLLQKWFAGTRHPAARDPYFLYAASNLGSIAGLLGYLVLFEPLFPLARQSQLWAAGYALLVLLTAACAWFALRTRADGSGRVEEWKSGGVGDPPILSHSSTLSLSHSPTLPLSHSPVPAARTIRWVALAFVPASLMLGLTTYITMDIAAVPLLWAVPLVLYLGSFMIAFARRGAAPCRWATRLLPILVLVQTVAFARATLIMPWLPLLHFATFFAAALALHGQLAADRPPPASLTTYYLLISLGGVLGGAFTALLAPLLFSSVIEYPVALVLACALCRRAPEERKRGGTEAWKSRRTDGTDSLHPPFRSSVLPLFHSSLLPLLAPPAIGLLTAGFLYLANLTGRGGSSQWVTLFLAVPAFLCYTQAERPGRFAAALAAALIAVGLNPGRTASMLHRERSFFGVHRVARSPAGDMHQLYHGTTIHGMQRLDPAWRGEPLTYYTRAGPIGQVFAAYAGQPQLRRMAVVGLGAGSLAAYAGWGQQLTFFEIDPVVQRLAESPSFFTYLWDARARGAEVRVVLGDARLTLAAAPDDAYGLIVLDAFSSDSIATHLLTREALRIYLLKLAPGGLIAFHVSNRCLNLKPVLGNLAADAGLTCLEQRDDSPSDTDMAAGRWPSQWVLMARGPAHLARVARDRRWRPLFADDSAPVWTDQYSNILPVILWRGS